MFIFRSHGNNGGASTHSNGPGYADDIFGGIHVAGIRGVHGENLAEFNVVHLRSARHLRCAFLFVSY